MAVTFSTLPSAPILMAATDMSSSSTRAWSETQSGSTACTSSTRAVSLINRPVVTDRPWQPKAEKVARSAWMPIAPTGSDTPKLNMRGEVWFCTAGRLRYLIQHFT
ncbi:hypothetical protein D3C72_2056270 [compost metagenome]